MIRLTILTVALFQLVTPSVAFNVPWYPQFSQHLRANSVPASFISNICTALPTRLNSQICAPNSKRWKMQSGQEAVPDLYKELKVRLKGSNVWLLGMDGCQKDLVGDFLARKLGYRFIDTNTIIEQLAKVPIDSALQSLGEESFVKVERAVLDQVDMFRESGSDTTSLVFSNSQIPENIWSLLRQPFAHTEFHFAPHRMRKAIQRAPACRSRRTCAP